MTQLHNPRLVFNAIPRGLPDPKHVFRCIDEHLCLESASLEGGVLVEAIALSVDPYMRNRMREPDTPGDMPAFRIGEIITGFGVARVLRSDATEFQVGMHVYGFMPFQRYAIFPSGDSQSHGMPALSLKILQNPYNLPWSYFTGAGEVIYIPAAAGAVGHMLVQMAKLKSLKVIASCGSDEKVAFVKSLGADHVFNWRTTDLQTELEKEGPIDIYFDGVGGRTLEIAIDNAAQRARFIICGMISQYNTSTEESYGIKNLWLLNRKRIRMEGYIVVDWDQKYSEEFYGTVPQQLASGKLQYKEHIYHGLESAGEAIVDQLTGKNLGKSVLILDETKYTGVPNTST
ncbi:NAD(P)-binding protein [Punctularia strigosozonata HHB-11173 SS5]|uniref:NAD(P)-binding protein n=1 Tax=Punctularia strigosozonata (strain HHB-11173) TaxID=741275 RepID=UPI000441800E|nr:NAD(P)-binding protein [Punctularia strigosozonata HHB-11173 SS5]EIN09198.1 NAD(P)-binding protein [Punctularia strigosozonata HHB-11173 SS5]